MDKAQQYHGLMKAVIEDRIIHARADLSPSKLGKARYKGCQEAWKLCSGKGPDSLIQLMGKAMQDEKAAFLNKDEIGYLGFQQAVSKRMEVFFIVECMEVFCVFNGEVPIVGNVSPCTPNYVYQIMCGLLKGG